MSISFYDLTVGSYVQILGAAVGFLQKGTDHFAQAGIDPDEFVETRLIDDMLDFHFQVTSVTHHSLGAVNAYTSGEFEPPKYEKCGYADLQALTQKTLDELKRLSRDDIESLAGNQVVFKLGGNEIPFTAENFALSFSLPNFYFHAATAYDLLRMKGVPLGKRDFMGKMKFGV